MSISWPLERGKDKRVRASMTPWKRFRLIFFEWSFLIALSIVLALVASIVSVLTAWLSTLREGHCEGRWYITRKACGTWINWPSNSAQFVVYTVLSVTLASAAAYLVLIAPGSQFSGIPELYSYFQGFNIHESLNKRTILAKILGIGCVSASGLWLGHEAPLVYVFGASTALICDILPISEARVRDLSLAACATGISVAFSAPLAGVIFAVEVFLPSKDVIWRIFVCSMITTVLLRSVIAQSSGIGGLMIPETGLFHVKYDRYWHSIELIPFALLGIIGGLYGSLVCRFASWPSFIYSKYPVLSVVIVTIITAFASYLTIVSEIPITELFVELFAECKNNSEEMLCKKMHLSGLIYTLILGSTLTPISMTLPLPSGFLLPSLVVGALVGRILGLGVRELLQESSGILHDTFCHNLSRPCITPGVYALVGAGAVLTGISRLTVTSVVLIFEITGGLSFIVPIMTGVMMSKWVADMFGGARGLLITLGAPEFLPVLPDSSTTIPGLYAEDIMVPASSVISLRQDGDHQSSITPCKYRSVPVLDSKGQFIEMLTVRSKQIEPTVVLTRFASLKRIISVMNQMGIRVIVICTDGKFQGLITRVDVISVLRSSKPIVTASEAAEFEIDSD